MKYLLYILLALLSFSPNAYGDNYPKVLGIDGDKWLHFGVSGLIVAGTYGLTTAWTGREVRLRRAALVGAIGVGLAVGLAKEIGDSMDNNTRYLDVGDLTADALGVAFTATMIYYLDIKGKNDNLHIGFIGKKAVLTYRW